MTTALERRLAALEASLAREGQILREGNAPAIVAQELRDVGCLVLSEDKIVVVDETSREISAQMAERLLSLASRSRALASVLVVVLRNLKLEEGEMAPFPGGAFVTEEGPPTFYEGKEEVTRGSVAVLASDRSTERGT